MGGRRAGWTRRVRTGRARRRGRGKGRDGGGERGLGRDARVVSRFASRARTVEPGPLGVVHGGDGLLLLVLGIELLRPRALLSGDDDEASARRARASGANGSNGARGGDEGESGRHRAYGCAERTIAACFFPGEAATCVPRRARFRETHTIDDRAEPWLVGTVRKPRGERKGTRRSRSRHVRWRRVAGLRSALLITRARAPLVRTTHFLAVETAVAFAAVSSAFLCAWSCAIRSPMSGPALFIAASCACDFAAPSSRTWQMGSQSFA